MKHQQQLADTASFVLENLRDVVILVDTNDRITNINHAAKIWLGWQENNIAGISVFDVLPEPELFKKMWGISNAIVKFKILKDGQTAWYEASITPLIQEGEEPSGCVVVVHDITQEKNLLETEIRRSAQLGLLEEVGRQIADSFDKKEILQRSIDAMVNRFGYAEAAISLPIVDNILEISVISGTEDFGYKPGFRQGMGKGIIGHTAALRKTYISNHVATDPYYFSNDEHFGSAICVPILSEKELLGVLYVESVKADVFNEEDAATLETLANQISASLQRASLYSHSQEHLRVMSTVQAVSRVIASSLDMETIFAAVVRELKETFGYTHVSIYLLKDDYLQLGAQIGYPKEMIIHKIHISQGVTGRTIKSKTVQFIRDTSKDPSFLRADNNITSEICVPLLKDNIVLGTLNVESNAGRVLTNEDLELLVTLSSPIALAVDNARLHAQVKAMAMTDAVSGLANRYALEQTLTAEVERSRRLNHPLSLIIFDIDSFKTYNDTWGHPAGDTRLKATAKMIRDILRKYDVAARYGGDEFAVILPNTDETGAFEFAKRLQNAARASTNETPVENIGVSGHTLSIGLATFPKDGNSLESLMLAADHAELTAKHLGKNQIFLASNLNKNESA